uniref:ARAD1A16104p n=1 Tax=Blastobotrys adeninivorans TaxID=409370 RepID=A0A060SXY1_BLAAD
MSNKSVRLPQLNKLRVKRSSPKNDGGPCMAIMSRMLNCWASSPQGGSAECAKLEIELKGCMANRRPASRQKSTTNYHAARLLKKVNPPSHD